MKPRDLADLLLLAAIWGASFLFMRMAVPAFGPVALAFVRVAGAALFLLPLLLLRGEAPVLRQRWRALLVLGLTNSALPFLLFGYAVYTLPAALAAIFNAATPLCTALIAWAWLGDPLNRWRSLGMALGFGGVAGLALAVGALKPVSAPVTRGFGAADSDAPRGSDAPADAASAGDLELAAANAEPSPLSFNPCRQGRQTSQSGLTLPG
jgi:drug/metabolite transporter (DMT)-like permease